MKTVFTAEIDGQQFEFHSMNVQELKLFQVYYYVNGKKTRFHLQKAGDKFVLPMPEREPQYLRDIEYLLDAAVRREYGL